MTQTAFETLSLERREGILIVTVNRPSVLNALDRRTVDELSVLCDDVRSDATVGAVIITGAGDKAFVAGGDIRELAQQDPRSARETAERGQSTLTKLERLNKPVIAAINGFALGGGCELALACHVRIAAEHAQIGLPEVTLGIIPGYGGTQRLARLVGKGHALHLILTGKRIAASEAYRIGLVNEVVASEKLLDTAIEMALMMMSRAPLALEAAIEAVNDGMDLPLEQGLRVEASLFALLYATADTREGLSAFVEKRSARFEGR